jgi:hypothetical protein|nr:MAG TPA: hypothetical protein [Caudoviricetes sp.]
MSNNNGYKKKILDIFYKKVMEYMLNKQIDFYALLLYNKRAANNEGLI